LATHHQIEVEEEEWTEGEEQIVAEALAEDLPSAAGSWEAEQCKAREAAAEVETEDEGEAAVVSEDEMGTGIVYVELAISAFETNVIGAKPPDLVEELAAEVVEEAAVVEDEASGIVRR